MSIKEIQKITKFSDSTISRVLNGKAKEYRISEETCRKIMDAAKEVNYRPNILARSLRLQKSMSIGLIVSDIQNPFFGALASNIETRLRQHGYSTILCNTNEVPENENFYMQVLMDRKVDGIIIAPTHMESWDHLESIKKETSIVLIDRVIHHSDLPWVTGDNTRAAEFLTNQLIEHGYRKIGYLGGIPKTYIESVRFAGFKNAFLNHSLKIDRNLVVAKGYSSSDGESMMENLLEKHPDIEAVVCVNNLVFFGAIGAVQRFEIETKRSIMMAAFDIGPYCKMFKRPLLCANQDLKVLADSAVSLLMDQIDKKEIVNRQIILPINVDKFRVIPQAGETG